MNAKKIKEQELTPRSPFQKFEDLARRLFAVPKKELDEKLEEFKTRQRKKQVKRLHS